MNKCPCPPLAGPLREAGWWGHGQTHNLGQLGGILMASAQNTSQETLQHSSGMTATLPLSCEGLTQRPVLCCCWLPDSRGKAASSELPHAPPLTLSMVLTTRGGSAAGASGHESSRPSVEHETWATVTRSPHRLWVLVRVSPGRARSQHQHLGTWARSGGEEEGQGQLPAGAVQTARARATHGHSALSSAHHD